MKRLWVGASSADVVVRLGVQLASTVVIARILSAESFGLATLVLVVATVMGALIGFPFEEAMSQRRILRRSHLETSLFASLILGVAGIVLALAFGPAIERITVTPGFAVALLIAAVFLLAEGPRAVARGMARRRRRFVELAVAQATSTAIACIVAVAVALAGWGVLALLIQRLLPNVIYPILTVVILLWRRKRPWVPTRWHRKRFEEIFRFCGFNFVDIGINYTAPAVLAFLVNAAFGIAALGQLNIALRIVDPLRAGLIGIGHNLAFSTLVKLQRDPQALVVAASRIAAGVSIVVMPIFAGLAVTAPVMLPVLVGPNWEAAVPLSQILCVAVGVSLPFRCFFSGYSALGRPDYNVLASLIALMTMTIVFFAAAGAGLPHVAGLAYLANELTLATVVFWISWKHAKGDILPAIGRMGRIGLAAGAMAVVVHVVLLAQAPRDPSLVYLIEVSAIGIVVFPLALTLLCRRCILIAIRAMTVRAS